MNEGADCKPAVTRLKSEIGLHAVRATGCVVDSYKVKRLDSISRYRMLNILLKQSLKTVAESVVTALAIHYGCKMIDSHFAAVEEDGDEGDEEVCAEDEGCEE